MPFVKKSPGQGDLVSPSTRALFIGRTHELLFFVQHLLKPEEPAYNILSIWGQGGVGKTTLLRQFKHQTETADFHAYCLTATVDERQETPASMMEQFAQQLHLGNTFEKALNRYKEALQLMPPSRSLQSWQDKMVTKVPDLAGALVEGVIPVAGPLLGEGVKATAEHLLDLHPPRSEHPATAKLDGPLHTLTQVFISELNHLAATKVTLPTTRTKRERRLFLFFDTFEQVADEAVPWLLHSVLELEINRNIVFILAGRNPVERSTAAGPKPWLPYYDDHTIYALPLHPFTQEETAAYLAERGITAKERIETIWHMSQGLPLYLGLLVSNMRGKLDPTKDVVDNFLQDIPAEEKTKRRLILDAALFSRPFNQDDLEAFPSLPEQERPALYEWLLRQPFVRASSLTGRYLYHDVAQELFQRYLFQSSPKTYNATRRLLATYYQERLEHLQGIDRLSGEQLEMTLALVVQLFCLSSEESLLQAVSLIFLIFRYGDSISNDGEPEQRTLKALRELIQLLSLDQKHSRAYHTANVVLYCLESRPLDPGPVNPEQKQEWLNATDTLLGLFMHGSSTTHELLANFYTFYGWGYAYNHEYQQAHLYFERALEVHPNSVLGRNGLGYLDYDLKNYQRAVEHFTHGLEMDPSIISLSLGRGRAYGRLGDYQHALYDFHHALSLPGGRTFQVYYNRARIYMELKDYHKALTDLDQAFKINPEYWLAAHIQFQRGCILLSLKDLAQAIRCFTSSGEITSRRCQELFLWAGEWSRLCQQFPDAQTRERLVTITLGESTYLSSMCRGLLFWFDKAFEEAQIELLRALHLRYGWDWPYFGRVYWQEWDAPFWLAMVYLALDQEEEARKAIEQAMALEMPPILLKPLRWFEQDKPELYKQLIKPLLDSYQV